MFFLKLLITGIIAGIIGFYILEKWLKSYLLSLPFGKQLVATLVLGLLYTVAFVTGFAGLIADLTQANVVLVWFILLLGIFSTNTIIILIVVFYVVLAGGYKEFVKIADESLAPLIAGTVGFLFGIIKPQESYSIYYDPGVIATVNFMAGLFGGFVSAVIAFITKKILNKLFPYYE